MASKLSLQQADEIFLEVAIEIREKQKIFHKLLRTRKFSTGNFFGTSTPEPLCTQDSEYVYKRGVEELPAKIGRCLKKPVSHNFENPPESIFLCTFQTSSLEDFALKSKL